MGNKSMLVFLIITVILLLIFWRGNNDLHQKLADCQAIKGVPIN